MTPEEKLRNRLESSKDMTDVFQSYADYNGEKAEEARKQSNIYLALIFVVVIILITSCLC
jgi:hypothetical protein